VTNGYLGVGEGAGTVSVLSTASNTITHAYGGMNEPIELAVSPSGGDVYVANVGAYVTGTTGHLTTPTIAVINTASGRSPTSTWPTSPTGWRSAPDGTRVYAATNNLSTGGIIFVINAATNGIIASVGGMETADTVSPWAPPRWHRWSTAHHRHEHAAGGDPGRAVQHRAPPPAAARRRIRGS